MPERVGKRIKEKSKIKLCTKEDIAKYTTGIRK
jgi:hypothetical protein